MLRVTMHRRLTCFPLTKGAKPMQLQSSIFTGRSSSHPFATSAVRNNRRVDDSTGRIVNRSTDHTPEAPLDVNGPSKTILNSEQFNLQALRIRFRQLSDRSAIASRRRADDFTAKIASTFSQLGSHLNRVTGYEEIEALKRRVVEQEGRIATTRQAAREAKTAYDEAVIQRSNSQRDVNDLLQRKSNWTDSDVSRFTTLVRQDHLYEQGEVRAKAAVAVADDAVDREFSQLMRNILARYHEEQVWSDKIRSASTYGSLAALGLNMVVFILAIIVIEPWKRRRLTQAFEKKIEEMSAENTVMVEGGMKDLARHMMEQEKLLSKMVEKLSRSRSSQVQENTTQASHLTPERMARAMDRNIEVAFIASTVIAGAIGWIARSWFGF